MLPKPFASSFMLQLRLLLVSLVLLPGFSAPTHAAARAFIVIGLSAGETQSARLQANARTLREGFLARGLSADAITTLGASGEHVRRDALLAALKPTAGPASASANDDTWLVLLGSSSARNGEPSFQISGARLTSADLAAAVQALPGHKYVVVATTASGGFLPPLLALPDVDAVAATADSGEVNEPRFAEAWAESLVATPQASFAELASAAAKSVESFYDSQSLAQGEHARLVDRASGKIIEAPFATATAPAASPAAQPVAPTPGFSVADIQIPKPSDDTEIEHRPATDETRALIAEARAAAKDDEHAAIFLRIDMELTVGRDFSVIERHRTRAYLRTGESLDDLGTLLLPSSPPDLITRLEGVRVITPDGAQVIVNPRSYDERRTEDNHEADDAHANGRKNAPTAPPLLPLPEVTAGCIIEAGWTEEHHDSGGMPEFSNEWLLAEHYPVRALHLSVTTPTDARWHVFAPNLPATVATETADTRTSKWALANLAAFEPRAGDPPAKTTLPWIGVSSLASWDAFAAWYQRIAAGSDTAGPAVAALADEIAKTHPDRAGRLRAAYERVAALRYVAVELGVGAFRPRTPEQVWKQRYGDCKDKANLLVAVLEKLAWQFNHAVARVPAAPADGQPQDLWLDTTDRLVPFGIVAPGDLGRQALAFNARGGAAFHEITAAQEPKSEWNEFYHFDAKDSTWTLRLFAKGSAEVTLRRLFAGMPEGIRAERIQSLLSWRGCVVQQVTASDPYDASVPFVATIKIAGTADAMKQSQPRALVPGLEFFSARVDQRSQELWWDEGRTWTFIRGQEEAGIGSKIPGHIPVPKPSVPSVILNLP